MKGFGMKEIFTAVMIYNFYNKTGNEAGSDV
jgi:hypothetical protein